MKWSGAGFETVETSAKPGGREFGVRGRDKSGRLTALGFLFLAPEVAPVTSEGCREWILRETQKADRTVTRTASKELARPGGLPVALTAYTSKGQNGLDYRVRGFVASGDLCGDLEIYSEKALTIADADVLKVFHSLELDMSYAPQFSDVAAYAQVLYQHRAWTAAAPLFEKALTMVPMDGKPFPSRVVARRVMRDQAGMSYGIAGDNAKARRVFEQGVAEDPDYPLYYYNLACADAGEKKLAEARKHLQQAFDRKTNVNKGETMPVPTEDDSFTPYRGEREFWAFLQKLAADK